MIKNLFFNKNIIDEINALDNEELSYFEKPDTSNEKPSVEQPSVVSSQETSHQENSDNQQYEIVLKEDVNKLKQQVNELQFNIQNEIFERKIIEEEFVKYRNESQHNIELLTNTINEFEKINSQYSERLNQMMDLINKNSFEASHVTNSSPLNIYDDELTEGIYREAISYETYETITGNNSVTEDSVQQIASQNEVIDYEAQLKSLEMEMQDFNEKLMLDIDELLK